MKTVMALAMVCMAVSVVAQPSRGEPPSPEDRARMMAERMRKELSLTNQQVEQITRLNLSAFHTRMPQDSIARKKMTDERAEQMKKILTPEQYEKWTELRNTRMRQGARMTPEQIVARRVALMKKELALTDQQAARIEQMQLEAWKNRKQEAENRKKEQVARQNQLKDILTPEQYAKWRELQKQQHRNRGLKDGHRPGVHGPHRPAPADHAE